MIMNIIFCINNTYVRFVSVTILSILENNKSNIKFYVLSNDIDAYSKKHLKKLIGGYPNASIEFMYVENKIFLDFKLNIKYISVETYYRYVIADFFPNMDKCLYLDADVIVNGDLNKFYNTNIDNYYCAGVKDLYIQEIDYTQKIGLRGLYINAGVMLFNLYKIREDNMIHKLFDNTRKMKDKIIYQDQDVINITFNGNIKEVDSVYNFASSNIVHEKNKWSRAVVIHYTGEVKPWNKKCKNGMRFAWRHYCGLYMDLMRRNVTEGNMLFDDFKYIHKIIDYLKWNMYKTWQ